MKPVDLSFTGFEFDNCKNKKKYSIFHKEYPLILSRDMLMAIEYLLWYVPNINSIQSSKNDMVESIDFDDFSFDIVMENMNLKKEDVVFLDYINPLIVNFYRDEICTNCQKIILTRYENESKTKSLLRHIRNAIAHGYFNVVDGILIGFDFKNENYKVDDCTGIFKIRPENLLKALKILDLEVTEEKLASIALKKTGYEVEGFEDENIKLGFDFWAKKGKKRYAVEVKKYPEHKTLPQDAIDKLIKEFSGTYAKDAKPVLFINTSLMTDNEKKKLRREKVILLDVKNIKKMLRGIDILKEIEKHE